MRFNAFLLGRLGHNETSVFPSSLEKIEVSEMGCCVSTRKRGFINSRSLQSTVPTEGQRSDRACDWLSWKPTELPATRPLMRGMQRVSLVPMCHFSLFLDA